LLLILCGAFILGGLLLFHSPLNLQAMLWLNHLTPGLDDFWSFITQFGEGGAALLMLLVITRFSLSGNALSLKIFLLGSLLSPLLKSWVASPRPLGVIEAGLLNSIGQPPSGANSMPSGHSLTVFATIGVVLLCFPLKARHWPLTALLVLMAVLVAISRIMVGAHWPADVPAGAGLLLGPAWRGSEAILFAWKSPGWVGGRVGNSLPTRRGLKRQCVRNKLRTLRADLAAGSAMCRYPMMPVSVCRRAPASRRDASEDWDPS
jgi:membrane-associated phospholipid phosphatase